LVVDRNTAQLKDMMIRDLPPMVARHDVVVVNNTRVLPARMRGKRRTGGAAEALLFDQVEPGRWHALIQPARKLAVGDTIAIADRAGVFDDLVITVVEHLGEGRAQVGLSPDVDLSRYGETPLPPYIHQQLEDPERYQTVFARDSGSAAAPTAGLHFSSAILDQLRSQGTHIAEVTLHVGLNTFKPVTAERVADHVIHREWCSVPTETAALLRAPGQKCGRVFAVGTTSARTLETWGRLPERERTDGWSGWTDIFITPGYSWTTVDALLTNFHLPRSTLLMMIQSFAGRQLAEAAYRHAIEGRYRFFSFGDAMLIV